MASTNKTPNLNLPQWVGTDKPERADFNQAMSDIETTLTQNTAGRFVLPGGLKICWGVNALDYANANVAQKALPFPFSFTVAPLVVIAGRTTASNGASEIPINHKVRNITTSGFIGVAHTSSAHFTAQNVVNYPINWLAIGY